MIERNEIKPETCCEDEVDEMDAGKGGAEAAREFGGGADGSGGCGWNEEKEV